MIERPSLRQLEYALALEREGHFGRAAAACGVSQPGLSMQVGVLEQRLGLKLFERDRRGLRVTAAGRPILERARAALAEVEGLCQAAARLAGPLRGELRLGVIPTVAPYVLPRALARLRRAYPELELALREERTARLVQLLDEGELDLALVALEADLGRARTVALYADPFVLAAPSGHPLASRAQVRGADLTAAELLLLEDGHCLRDQVLSACGPRSRERQDLRATSLGTLVRMVASGAGLTLLPTLARGEVHAADQIALVPLVRPTRSRTIGLAWRPSTDREDEFQLLADLFRASAPKGVVPVPRSRTR